jgi:uncharacterized protein (TIGR02466 family)
MKLEHIFSTFLAVEQLKFDNKPLEDYCFEQRVKSPGREISNRGGWQGELDKSAPVVAPLITHINFMLNDLHDELGYKKEYRLTLDNMWVNINGPKDFNVSHKHNKSWISGVYYIKCNQDSGDLRLATPVAAQEWDDPTYAVETFNGFNSVNWRIPPEAGKIILFPSWLAHFVEPNLSQEERISIAFNVQLNPVKKGLTGAL